MSAPDTTPRAHILGFEQDETGDWVARLTCGHRQHVRHDPPWQSRPWVTTDGGRQAHIGAELACPLCRMPRLPPGAKEYKRTRTFDEHTTPAGLKKDHATKSAVWGKIVVLQGRVGYRIAGLQEGYFMLRAGVDGIIAPAQLHHVEPQRGSRFYVAFLRAPQPD